MALETKPSQSEIEKVRRQIAEARARIAQYKKEHPGEPFPFTKARGILKGKVHFTERLRPLRFALAISSLNDPCR